MESKKPKIRFFPEYLCDHVLWETKNEITEKVVLSTSAVEKSRIIINLHNDTLNPLYQGFPSFWQEKLCVFYNSKGTELFQLICYEIGDKFEIVNHFLGMHEHPELNFFLNDPVGYCLSHGVTFGDQKVLLKEVRNEQARYLQYEEFVLSNRLEEAFDMYLNYTWGSRSSQS